LITTDDILDEIDDEEIFRHYINESFIVGSVFNSPLRDTDDFPSFGIFRSYKYNMLLFKDLATDLKGDAVVFVKNYFDYNSIYKACSRIALDFGLQDKYTIDPSIISDTLNGQIKKPNKKPLPRQRLNIKIKIRSWEDRDKNYWKQFGITKNTLNTYNVKPITHYFINTIPVKCDDLTYAYNENKDKFMTYKIYQPLTVDRKNKWKSNVDNSVWQGWTQIPDSGDSIIITKSYKDIMSIRDTVGYDSVALQSESYIPKHSVVEELKSRFKKVYVLFDNDYDNPDNPGRKFSTKFCKEFDLIHLEIPSVYQSKDYSDLVKNHGIASAKEILKKLINE